MPELTPETVALIGARWVLFLFALTVHEAAHAWMAKMGGDSTAEFEGRLSLNPLVHIDPLGTVLLPLMSAVTGWPLLGWARPVPVREENLRHSSYWMWIALAGPLSNLLLMVWMLMAIYVVALVTGNPTAWMESPLTVYFLAINLILIVFNMIPVPPLDGSRVFFHLFVRGRTAMFGFWRGMEQYGFYVLLLVIFIPPLRDAIFLPYAMWAIGHMWALVPM